MSKACSADLFHRPGYGGNHNLLEATFEEAGLSRPEKNGISLEKEETVRDLLAARFIPVCSRGDCHNKAYRRRGRRTVVAAETRLTAESVEDRRMPGQSSG
ncbi:MAG TPA: hypothetical protein VE569_03305 [Acidimicrobiia bacterium]|nr:hypothetical protein [Acidimicrobiia bacterium]